MHILHAADDYFKCLMRRYFENYDYLVHAHSSHSPPSSTAHSALALSFQAVNF